MRCYLREVFIQICHIQDRPLLQDKNAFCLFQSCRWSIWIYERYIVDIHYLDNMIGQDEQHTYNGFFTKWIYTLWNKNYVEMDRF